MVQHIRGRAFGIFVLIVQFLLLWPYGFQAKIFNAPSALLENGFLAFLYFITLILAVLGYGLLLAYYRSSPLTAIFQSLFVVSYTILLLPPWMQFWYNTFIGNFDSSSSIAIDQFGFFNVYHDHNASQFQLSYFFLRIALFCSISQLIALHAFFGRVGLLATALFSTIFQLGWVFVFYLCISISRNSPHKFIYDDYLAANVYVFGSTFGLFLALLIRKPKVQEHRVQASRISTILSMVGTFFVFLSFAASNFFHPTRFTNLTSPIPTLITSTFGFNTGTMNVFFAMSASMVSSLMISALVSQKITIRIVVWASVMGGILFASVGNTMDSITGPISIGIVAGIISGLFFQIGYNKINRNKVFDSYGVLGTFFINSILASFFIAPLVLIAMTNAETKYLSIGNRILNNRDQAGWVLIYFALSLAFGFISALIAAAFIKCFASLDSSKDFEDTLLFDPDFGLYEDQDQRRVQKVGSKENMESGNVIQESKDL